MIPNHKERNVETSGLDEQAVFGISVNNQAHIMTILRDTLYTDKILAVLREYSANAWDSHRMSGKENLPIKVTLPTPTEPTLQIRDFGPGLTQEEVFTVFTQYGASTKRTTDKAVGTLGIGCKSGFAYSDSFSVDSYNGGVKSTYVAVLDKSEKGVITLLNREPCGEETGLCIQIPVKPEDIPLFVDKAKGLFRYFIPKPDINTEVADMAEIAMEMKAGMLTKSGGWVAVMGCIPYRINIDQLQAIRSKEEEATSIRRFLSKMNGLLFFRIGEIQIAANREDLRYPDETKLALINRFNDLIEEYVSSALKDIQDSGLTQFERRMRLGQFETLKFAIPDVLKDFMNPSIEVKDLKDFSFYRLNSYGKKKMEQMERFDIHEHLCFVLKDDSRAFEGFKLPEGRPYIVKRKPQKTMQEWSKLFPKFEKWLESMRISGVKVVKLSECAWEKPTRVYGHREVNEKHKVSAFRYSLTARGYGNADDWVIESRKPEDTDVFVVLKKFKTYRSGPYLREVKYNFHGEYKEMKAMVEFFGEKMPEIYGYKSTEKNPVDLKKTKGTEFLKWVEAKKQELLAKATTHPNILAMVEKQAWANLKDAIYYDTRHTEVVTEAKTNDLVTGLGETHPLVEVLKPYAEAELMRRKYEINDEVIKEIINESKELSKMKEKFEKSFLKRIKSIRSKYPLLENAQGGLSNLLRAGSKHWIQYVQMMDKENNDVDAAAQVHPHQRVIDSCVQGKDAHGQELPAELRGAPQGADGEGLGQHPQVLDGQQSTG